MKRQICYTMFDPTERGPHDLWYFGIPVGTRYGGRLDRRGGPFSGNCYSRLFIAVIFTILGYGVARFFGLFAAKIEPTTLATIPLVALADRINDGGRFFLGFGSINSQLHYFYYTQGENGEIVPGKILANSVKLFEEERDNAVLQTVSDAREEWFFCNGGSWQEIRVPKGAVKRDFALDLA